MPTCGMGLHVLVMVDGPKTWSISGDLELVHGFADMLPPGGGRLTAIGLSASGPGYIPNDDDDDSADDDSADDDSDSDTTPEVTYPPVGSASCVLEGDVARLRARVIQLADGTSLSNFVPVLGQKGPWGPGGITPEEIRDNCSSVRIDRSTRVCNTDIAPGVDCDDEIEEEETLPPIQHNTYSFSLVTLDEVDVSAVSADPNQALIDISSAEVHNQFCYTGLNFVGDITEGISCPITSAVDIPLPGYQAYYDSCIRVQTLEGDPSFATAMAANVGTNSGEMVGSIEIVHELSNDMVYRNHYFGINEYPPPVIPTTGEVEVRTESYENTNFESDHYDLSTGSYFGGGYGTSELPATVPCIFENMNVYLTVQDGGTYYYDMGPYAYDYGYTYPLFLDGSLAFDPITEPIFGGYYGDDEIGELIDMEYRVDNGAWLKFDLLALSPVAELFLSYGGSTSITARLPPGDSSIPVLRQIQNGLPYCFPLDFRVFGAAPDPLDPPIEHVCRIVIRGCIAKLPSIKAAIDGCSSSINWTLSTVSLPYWISSYLSELPIQCNDDCNPAAIISGTVSVRKINQEYDATYPYCCGDAGPNPGEVTDTTISISGYGLIESTSGCFDILEESDKVAINSSNLTITYDNPMSDLNGLQWSYSPSALILSDDLDLTGFGSLWRVVDEEAGLLFFINYPAACTNDN